MIVLDRYHYFEIGIKDYDQLPSILSLNKYPVFSDLNFNVTSKKMS
jgi:hypothetical protein